MKSRPIIFSTESVRAILEGRKTQTRRILKPQPPEWILRYSKNDMMRHWPSYDKNLKCLHGKPGDRLWVRETWRPRDPCIDDCGHVDYCTRPCFGDYRYGADYSDAVVQDYGPWKSPMFMPKTASRITLEIVRIDVQRLQDISDGDARNEGYEPTIIPLTNQKDMHSHVATLIDAWDTLNAKRGFSWESNPWVWVIEFKKLEFLEQ